MAVLNWKQNIGVGNLTSEQRKELLKNFNYPTEIDKKGRLLINAGLSKFVIAFKNNGPDSTLIGVSHFKMKAWAFILFIIFICLAVIPGFIFALIINAGRKKVFFEAVRLMNQNIDKISSTQNTDTDSDASDKIKKLKSMLDDGILTQEEFDSKKKELLSQI